MAKRKYLELIPNNILPHGGLAAELKVEEGTNIVLENSNPHRILLDSRQVGCSAWTTTTVGHLTAEDAKKLKMYSQAICDIINSYVPKDQLKRRRSSN
ncbi:hypothetical protein HQ584_07760 [Patescibacteria group bacterium]|nr:hypothetical protein [Patescibacteria group bacterium]